MMQINLPKIRNFIIRERLYVWLLIFVISINIALALTGEEKAAPSFKKFSNKVFKENLTREDLSRLVRENKKIGAAICFLSFVILFAIAAGLFLDVIVFILKREGAVLVFPTLLHKEPRWGIWDACKVVILFVWFSYMLTLIESAISEIFPIIKTNDNMRSVLNATITDILVFAFIIYFAVYEYREKAVSLGLSVKNFLANVFYGIMGYLAVIPPLLLILIFLIWVSNVFKYTPPMQPVLEIFLEEKKGALIMYLTIFVTVFGPIVEEIFFRGFMYTAVKKRVGFKAAIFSTSALFALLHTNLAGFLPIMVLGMLLAYLFEKTGTLVASCTVHILHNAAMVMFVFLMKGIVR